MGGYLHPCPRWLKCQKAGAGCECKRRPPAAPAQLLGPPFQPIADADDHGRPVVPWEDLAGLNGTADRCTCSDQQLALVGCDCDARQNLPIACECGAWLRSMEEILNRKCAGCFAQAFGLNQLLRGEIS